MTKRSLLGRFLTETTGQDLAEYGIALAVIGLGAGLAAIALAIKVNSLWEQANSVIGAVITGT